MAHSSSFRFHCSCPDVFSLQFSASDSESNAIEVNSMGENIKRTKYRK